MKENMGQLTRKTRTFPLSWSDWGSHVFCIIDHSCDAHCILVRDTYSLLQLAAVRISTDTADVHALNQSKLTIYPRFEIWMRSSMRSFFFLDQLCLLQYSMIKGCKYEGEYLINIFFRIETWVNRSLCLQLGNFALFGFVLEQYLARSA